MGYDVSIELADAKLREAYDAAAEKLGISHDIETYGDSEPSDWQMRELWSCGSAGGDLADYLKVGAEVIKRDEDDYCPDYRIATEELVTLGYVHDAIRHVLPTETDILDALGIVSEEDAWDYWQMLSRGIQSVTKEYVSVPLPRAVSFPALKGTVTHDDKSAPAKHGDGKAWEAYVAYLGASSRLGAAKSQGEDEDAVAKAQADLAEAEAAYDAVRPSRDSFQIAGGSATFEVRDETVTVEREQRDPAAGFAFKAKVASSIDSAVSDGRQAYSLYELIEERPGFMLYTFSRLGEIGRAAKLAGIDTLVVSPSW